MYKLIQAHQIFAQGAVNLLEDFTIMQFIPMISQLVNKFKNQLTFYLLS